MAKFGVFHSGSDEPYRTIEGDDMNQDKEIVKIWKGQGENATQVAAIVLDKGQSVQRIGN
jgi:hypothetical protein